MASKTKATLAMEAQEREEAGDRLRATLPPGTTVWCVLRHYAPASGRRSIRLITVARYPQPDGTPDLATLDGDVSTFTGWKMDPSRGGIVTDAMGTDAGWSLVYELGRQLYPHGYDCIGEHCAFNGHMGDVPRSVVPGDVRHPGTGYVLKCRWL